MTDIMKTLYRYANENMVRGMLNQEWEYAKECLYVEEGEEKLRTLIAGEHQEFLELLLEKQKQLWFAHEEALFLAGFKIALELTR